MKKLKEIKEEKLKILREKIKILNKEEKIKLKEIEEKEKEFKEKKIEFEEKEKELKKLNNELINIEQLKRDKDYFINYEIKHGDNEKEIRIINILSGEKIILEKTINMIDTLTCLYYKIRDEINKVNISNMIINKYVYTREEYLKSNKSSLEDTCLDRCILLKVPNVRKCHLSELFDKDYDEDYIEVSLIFGSYIPYLKEILDDYKSLIYHYTELMDFNTDNDDYLNLINSNNSDFVSKLLILDNNYLSLEDYNEIVLYINNNFVFHLMKYQNYLLNEIQNYFTIN